MCHCQPHTAPGFGQPVLISGIQYEVIPFSPLWLHIRSAFSLRERFLILTLLPLSFVQHSLSRLRPTEAGGLAGRARYSLRPVVLSGKVRLFGFHGTPSPRSGSNCGTEGPTLLVFCTLLSWPSHEQHRRRLLWLLGTLHWTRELAPAVRDDSDAPVRSHVVRSDFCCLLSCCCLSMLEITIPRGYETGLGLGFPLELVICTDISIRSMSLL